VGTTKEVVPVLMTKAKDPFRIPRDEDPAGTPKAVELIHIIKVQIPVHTRLNIHQHSLQICQYPLVIVTYHHLERTTRDLYPQPFQLVVAIPQLPHTAPKTRHPAQQTARVVTHLVVSLLDRNTRLEAIRPVASHPNEIVTTERTTKVTNHLVLDPGEDTTMTTICIINRYALCKYLVSQTVVAKADLSL
jgi:hypothetical protein